VSEGLARCSFFVRRSAADGWLYERGKMHGGPEGTLTIVPPAVGDLIYVEDVGTCVVVTRSWTYASWGSMDWPYNAPTAIVPPLLDLIVEPADGPFADEVGAREENQ